jgi:hypothetical protein
MNIMNNRKAAPGINPPSNPTRPKERRISIRQTLFLISILHSLRFVLLCLFLPAISLSIGQVPGTPYGVQSLDCSSVPVISGTITLSTDYVVVNTAFTAGISEVAGAKYYEWELASGLSGSSNGPSITVTATNTGTFASSAITVKAVNDCGSSSTVGNENGFSVSQQGSSATLHGKSSWCTHDALSDCVCTAGVRVFFNEATEAQKAAAFHLFVINEDVYTHSWWDGKPGFMQAHAITNGTWVQRPGYIYGGVAVCFD